VSDYVQGGCVKRVLVCGGVLIASSSWHKKTCAFYVKYVTLCY